MAVLFITHDLGVVAQAAEKVAVMYAGKIVEYSTVENLFAKPLHPYTQGLLESIPARCSDAKEKQAYLKTIPGSVPDLYRMARSCRFHDRCPFAFAECELQDPPLLAVEDGHLVSCWKYGSEKNN